MLHEIAVAFDTSISREEGVQKSTKKSEYFNLGGGVSLRVADHQGDAETFARHNHPNDNYGIVIKLSPHRFKDKDGVDYLEYVYYPDKMTDAERQKEIVDGLRGFVETGDFSKLPRPDRVNKSGKFKEGQVMFMSEDGSLDAAVRRAEKETERAPSDGQKEAGNYRKGHVRIDGFDISIEQARGSVRSGVDENGKKWSTKMHNTYGYIRGTKGADGDHVDVFLSDHLDDWNGMVFVVDQVKKDGSFDEHKVMYGFNDYDEAWKAYHSNYEKGWQGLGDMNGITLDGFKKWLDSGDRKGKEFSKFAYPRVVTEKKVKRF